MSVIRRVATLLIVLSGCMAAWAGDCWPTPRISLNSDEIFDLRVLFDDAPAVATPLQVYAEDKLVHAGVTDGNGRVRFVLLPGKYRVILRDKGTLDVEVLPQQSHLNGPLISWHLFPDSEYKWVAGKRVAGKRCPMVALKAD